MNPSFIRKGSEIAQFALEALNIDKYGLDEIDNKILCTIIDKFKYKGFFPNVCRQVRSPHVREEYAS